MQQIEKYLRQVNLVRTFNPTLKARVEHDFNRNVFAATAGIDPAMVADAPAHPITASKIRITYVTGRGPADPLCDLFLPALRQLLMKYPDQVESVFWNGVPQLLADLPGATSIPPIYDYEKFMRALSSGGFDIGLAPLRTIPSDLAKTNTKFRDYGLCRIAGIYSNVDVYTRCVKPGVTGLIVNQSANAWYEAMEELVLNNELRSSIQENAYQDVVQNYNQQIMEHEWLEIIENLVSSRQAWITSAPLILNSMPKADNRDLTPQDNCLILGQKAEVYEGFVHAGFGHMPGQVPIEENKPLPFLDHQFDLVVCYYFLETLTDLSRFMRELYRISKPGARIVVISSYANQQINKANPNYRTPINEHTFRYWTSAALVPVPDEEYTDLQHPWGLLPCGNADIDLRPTSLEFYYTTDYAELSVVDQRSARKKYWDVCDVISAQFEVFKPEEDGKNMVEPQPHKSYAEPALIERRFRHHILKLENDLAHTADRADALQVQVEALNLENSRLSQLAEAANIQNSETELKSSLDVALQQVAEMESRLALAQTQNTEFQSSLDIVSQQIAVFVPSLQNISRQINRQVTKDIRTQIPLPLIPLKDDSILFQDLRGFQLSISQAINKIPFVPYKIRLNRPGLSGVALAFHTVFLSNKGQIGIEIVDSSQQILRHEVLPAASITPEKMVQFQFEPIATTNEGVFEIRVFATQVDIPISLLEWQLPVVAQRSWRSRWRKIFAALKFSQ